MTETAVDELKAEWFSLGWTAAIREAARNVALGRDEFWDEQARDAGDEVLAAKRHPETPSWNATALETLERRLDATRRALIGEQERLQGAREQAAHAAGYVQQVEDGIRKSEQIIADLQDALDELRGPTPAEAGDPLDVTCPSCNALPGEPCTSPNGDVLQYPHVTRGSIT